MRNTTDSLPTPAYPRVGLNWELITKAQANQSILPPCHLDHDPRDFSFIFEYEIEYGRLLGEHTFSTEPYAFIDIAEHRDWFGADTDGWDMLRDEHCTSSSNYIEAASPTRSAIWLPKCYIISHPVFAMGTSTTTVRDLCA